MRAILLAILLAAPFAGAQAPLADADDTGAPPTIRILAPEDGVGAAGTLALRGVAEDPDTPIDDVQVRVDRGAWTSVDTATRSLPTATWSHALDLSALPPGEHLVEVRATDGGIASAPGAIRVATDFGNAPPSIGFVSPREGDAFPPGAVVDVRLTADDADGGVAGVEVRADGGAWRAAAVGDDGVWSVAFDGLVEGVHALEARAHDDRGAASIAMTARVAVGLAARPPLVEVLAPLEGQGFAVDGVQGCLVVVPCVLVAGTTDRAVERVTVSVDGGPDHVLSSGLGLVGTAWRLEWPSAGTYAGPHTFRVRAIDAGGEASVAHTVTVQVASTRLLGVRVTPGVVDTDEPFTVRLTSADGAASAAWYVDGVPAANGTVAELRVKEAGVHEVLARVRDTQGRSGVALGVVQVLDRPPVVALRVDPFQPRVGETVRFDASEAVDPDGRVVAWRFDFGDGSGTPWLDRPVVDHAYTRKAAMPASVTVRDEAGSTASSSVLVDVANTAPTVRVIPSDRRPDTGEVVRMEADVFDPDDAHFSFLWEFPDGTQAGTKVVSYAFDRAGPAAVSVQVVDAGGLSALATYAFEVQDVAPRVAFDVVPEAPTTRDVVHFQARAVDVDGQVTGMLWDFGDGNTSTERAPYHQFVRDGNYLVRLEVTDDAGGVGFAERVVRVGNSAPLVEFNWTPVHPSIADTVVFVGRTGDLDGDVLEMRWALEDSHLGLGPEMTHRFERRGTFNVTLEAIDDDAAVGSLTRVVEVVNGLPEVVLPDVVAAHVGVPVALQAQAIDADGAVVEVRWDADGDGVDDYRGMGRTLAWTYRHAGIYGASFTAVDDLGAVVTGWMRVEVTFPPPADDPPTVTVLTPVDGALLSGPARIEGASTDDFGVQVVEWQVRDGADCGAESEAAPDEPAGCEDVYPGGGAWAAAGGVSPWAATLDTRVLRNGEHTLVARAWDGTQWGDVDIRTFSSLNDPQETPAVALQVLVPAPGARVAGLVTLQGASFHPQGVARVLVGIDSQDPVPANGTVSWSMPWDTRNATAGVHTLTFRAELASGLYRVVKVKVHVNNEPPTLYVRPVEGAVSGLLTLRGNVAIDREAEVVRVRIDDGPAVEAVGTTRWSWSVDTRTLSDGPHQVEVTAVGSDGIASWPHTFTIQVQNSVAGPAPETPNESPGGAWIAAFAALGAAAASRTPRRRM